MYQLTLLVLNAESNETNAKERLSFYLVSARIRYVLNYCRFFLIFQIVAGFVFTKFGALRYKYQDRADVYIVDWMNVLRALVNLKGTVESIQAYSIH